MSSPRHGSPSPGRRALLVTGALAASLTVAAAAPAASPAATPAAACPSPYPVADLVAGQQATGLTVSSGQTPEPFTAEVIGVLRSPIWPGVDMVVVSADSPAIRSAGGVWAGMSGSPVYADDGRLIGAVAFGLSGAPSRTVGLTPAEAMLPLLDLPAASDVEAAGDRGAVPLPQPLQDAAVRSGAATPQAARSGMEQLPVPLSVSGLGRDRLPAMEQLLDDAGLGPAVLYAGSSGPGSGEDAAVVAGGNLASALSSGDVTAAGVGTTTAVCGDRAVAFGHPMLLLGASAMAAHLADALYVQPDALFGPYKVANLGTAVGTVDQDRATGLRAVLGALPVGTEVSSTVSAPSSGARREGTTRVNEPQVLPGLASMHVLANLDIVLQHVGPGTGEISWTATGRTAEGETWTFARQDRLADPFDVTWTLAAQLAPLQLIRDNRFTGLDVASVSVDATVEETFRQYTLEGLELAVGEDFVPVDPAAPVVASPGDPLLLRAVLRPYQGRGEVQRVPVTVDVPAELAGQMFTVSLDGGTSAPAPDPAQATSFDDLLDRLERAPRGDQLTTRAVYGVPGVPDDVQRTTLDQAVSGSISLVVEVSAAPAGAR